MVKNWCNVLSMEGVTVCGHHPECRVTFGRYIFEINDQTRSTGKEDNLSAPQLIYVLNTPNGMLKNKTL